MKRTHLLSRLGAVVLCLLLCGGLLPSALAAHSGAHADFHIYVNAKDGQGLNLRTGAGTEYAKVLPDPVPMYTKLHISGTDTSSTGAQWGYTSYNGASGWICLVETTTSDPRANYQTSSPASVSYDIYVNAKDGQGLNLRTGAGTEYGKVLSAPIPMYTKLHITLTDHSSTGAQWGYTSYGGASGWVCLVETTTYDPRGNQDVAAVPYTEGTDTAAPADNAAPQPQADQSAAQADSSATVSVALLAGVGVGLLLAILIVVVGIAVMKKK